MSKFKVGDKVACVKCLLYRNSRLIVGYIGEVTDVEDDFISVDGKLSINGSPTFSENAFELYEDGYRIGDVVTVVESAYMNAPVGSVATVVGYGREHGEKFIDVVWDRKHANHSQMDGLYYKSWFTHKKVDEEEQLKEQIEALQLKLKAVQKEKSEKEYPLMLTKLEVGQLMEYALDGKFANYSTQKALDKLYKLYKEIVK